MKERILFFDPHQQSGITSLIYLHPCALKLGRCSFLSNICVDNSPSVVGLQVSYTVPPCKTTKLRRKNDANLNIKTRSRNTFFNRCPEPGSVKHRERR